MYWTRYKYLFILCINCYAPNLLVVYKLIISFLNGCQFVVKHIAHLYICCSTTYLEKRSNKTIANISQYL